MKTHSTPQSHMKCVSPILKVFSSLVFAMHFLTVLLYCSGGIAVYYGKSLTVASAIRQIAAVLDMGRSYYRMLFGVALGILYIVVLVFLIKDLCSCFSYFRKATFYKLHLKEDAENAVFSMGILMGRSFSRILLVVFACGWIDGFTFPANTKIIIVLGIALYLLTRAVYFFIKGYTPLSILIQMGITAVFVLSLILTLLHTAVPAIDNGSNAIMMLFSAEGISQIVSTLFDLTIAVLYIVMAGILISTLSFANEYLMPQNNAFLRSKSKGLVYTALFFSLAALIVYIVNGGALDIDHLLALFKPYFALTCAAVAVCLTTYIPFEMQMSAYLQEEKSEGSGVLTIPEGTTAIEAEAYRDRTDLVSVFIPESVSSVGKNAFYGCGGIAGIYCTVPSKPEGWDPEWNNGCYATVHWGYHASHAENISESAPVPSNENAPEDASIQSDDTM